MPTLADKRPVGFVPLGVFFFFGATMATFAAVTLAIPGTVLDQVWKLNPAGHAGLAPLGRIMAVPFLFLALVLLVAGIGWLRRRSDAHASLTPALNEAYWQSLGSPLSVSSPSFCSSIA